MSQDYQNEEKEATQKEKFTPNFTQIPNIVFDYWMQRLSPSEFKVLICLCRKLYGWHKTSDYISASQIARCTGLTKKTILKAVDTLTSFGLILKSRYSDDLGNHPNEYMINIEKPDDEIYQTKQRPEGKFSGGSGKITPGVVEKLHQGGGVKITPTKERPFTKERTPPTPSKGDGVGASSILNLGENGNCLLTQDEKEKLLKKMTPSELEYWIEEIDIAVGAAGGQAAFNKKYKTKSPTHYFTILAWKRRRASEGKTSGASSEQSNQEYAKQVAKDFSQKAKQCNCRIEILSKSIEFSHLSGGQPIVVSFKENAFKEQVQNALRKWRII